MKLNWNFLLEGGGGGREHRNKTFLVGGGGGVWIFSGSAQSTNHKTENRGGLQKFFLHLKKY